MAPAKSKRGAAIERIKMRFPPVKGKEEGTAIAQTVSLEESKRFKESFTALRLWGEEYERVEVKAREDDVAPVAGCSWVRV